MERKNIVLVAAFVAWFYLALSSAFAAIVEIQPDPAYDNDNLFCYVDGSLKPGFYYKWLANGDVVYNLVKGKYFVGSLQTHAGDIWECEAYSPNPRLGRPPIFVGEDIVLIQPVATANNPPFQLSNPSPQNFATNVNVNHDLSWTGGDPDGDPVTHDVYFEAGDTTPDILVSSQQSTSFDPGTLSFSTTYYWKIIARDPEGLTTEGPVWRFTTQAAPPINTASVINSIQIIPQNPTASDTLTCSVSGSDAGSSLQRVEFRWFVNLNLARTNTRLVSGSSFSVNDQLSSFFTEPSDIVRCEAEVFDTAGLSDSDQIIVTIQSANNTPTINFMQINPSNPDEFDTLTCFISASDSDGNLDRAEFRWFVNSALRRTNTRDVSGFSTSASDQLSHTETDAGDSVRCEARVFDTSDLSVTQERTVTIIDSGLESTPVINSMQLSPSNPTQDDTLTCSLSVSDSDGNLDRAEFRWFVNSNLRRTSTESVSNSSDSASDQLSSSETDAGDSVRCEARVFDSSGLSRIQQRFVTIRDADSGFESRPVINSLRISPSNPDESDTLTCLVSVSDSDGDLDSVEFRWFVNSNLIETNTESVSGSSDSANDRLSSEETEEGDFVRCEVRVFDEEGLSRTQQRSVSIRGDGFDFESTPVITSIQISPTNPTTSDTLTCRVSASDNDGNLDRVEFRWFVDSVLRITNTRSVSGFSDSTTDQLSAFETDPGDSVRCEARVFDDDGRSRTQQRSVIIRDGIDTTDGEDTPAVSIITISPSSPTQSDTLTCSVAVFDSDGNLDRVQIFWKVNSQTVQSPLFDVSGISDSSSATLTPGQFREGDTVSCEVRVSDTTGRNDFDQDSVIISGRPSPSSQPPLVVSTGINVLPTQVEIFPKSLDMKINSIEFISIVIFATQRETFDISVQGVPEDWLSFERTVIVDGRRIVHISVNPKAEGNYNINVQVAGASDVWQKNIDLFVASDSVSFAGGDGITGRVTGERSTGLVTLIIAVIIIGAFAAYLVQTYRKKKKEEARPDYSKHEKVKDTILSEPEKERW